MQSPQTIVLSLAATALLTKLDRKRRGRCSEAVWRIDFSHSGRKVEYIEQLCSRSRHSPCHCLVLVHAIAFQLVRNGRYEAVDRKSSSIVLQEMSDLWRAATPDPVNASDTFSQRKFTAALEP